MALTLAVLGHVDVCFERTAVSLPAKAQALLVYLAFAERPVRRELLADMFWGETGEGGARANLRLALSRLRQTLPGVIAADAHAVSLQTGLVHEVDALTVLRAASTTPRLPAAELKDAMARYRGAFLGDFTLRDCPDFEDWAAAQRVRIDRHAVVLLRELAQSARAGGDLRGERQCLERWADIEPWNEEAVLPLMQVLATEGAVAAALDRHAACGRALAEVRGTRASAALDALADRVRQGGGGRSGALAAEAAAAGAAGAATQADPLQSAPAVMEGGPASPLIGRDAELHRIAEQARRGERLLVLLGPAGIGKSRLAHAAARQALPRYPDGAVFCSFDFVDAGATEETSQAHFIATLGAALGLDFTQTAQPMMLLAARLRTLRAVLCLDGFEACEAATPVVAQVVQAAPGCLFLITSRTRPALAEGWVHEVRGLDTTGSAGREPAVQMLRACARGAGVELGEAEPHAPLARLARLLDGSPLAIQFAAQSLRLMSAAQLADKLEKGGWPDSSLHLPAYRHSTLQDVMADVGQQMDAGLREAWARCALFKGDFSLEWACECAGLTDAQVAALVDRSILGREPGRRLRMHELTRQYGLGMLDQLPQGDEHRRAFARAALAKLVAVSPALLHEDTGVMDLVQPDISTLASAFELALRREPPPYIHAPLQALCRVYHRLGWSYAAVNLLDSVLAQHAGADAVWRVQWHYMAGEATRNFYGFQRAGAHYKQAVALGGAQLPRGRAGAVLVGLAASARALAARPHERAERRDAAAAMTHCIAALLLPRYINGASVPELFAGMSIAWLTARRSGRPDARLAVLLKLLHFMPPNAPAAVLAWLARQIDACLKRVDPPRRAYAIRDLGVAMIVQNRWDEAAEYLNRASSMLAALGYGYHALESLTELHSGWLHKGHFAQALDEVRRCEHLARQQNQATILRWTLLLKMQVLLRLGAAGVDEARACLQEVHAIPVYRSPVEELSVLGHECLLAATSGDVPRVLDHSAKVLALARNVKGRGRFYLLFVLQLSTDAALSVALDADRRTPEAAELAVQLADRYLALSGHMLIQGPRRRLYAGAIAWLQGRAGDAVQAWREGAALCADGVLSHDAARLQWLLSLHVSDAGDARRHADASAAMAAVCGVAPPYPLMPPRAASPAA